MRFVEDEDQLAWALGHELAHLIMRHRQPKDNHCRSEPETWSEIVLAHVHLTLSARTIEKRRKGVQWSVAEVRPRFPATQKNKDKNTSNPTT